MPKTKTSRHEAARYRAIRVRKKGMAATARGDRKTESKAADKYLKLLFATPPKGKKQHGTIVVGPDGGPKIKIRSKPKAKKRKKIKVQPRRNPIV